MAVICQTCKFHVRSDQSRAQTSVDERRRRGKELRVDSESFSQVIALVPTHPVHFISADKVTRRGCMEACTCAQQQGKGEGEQHDEAVRRAQSTASFVLCALSPGGVNPSHP